MIISGALIRSARALVEVSRKKLSIRSGVAEKDIAKFENQGLPLRDPDREALKDALEEFGAVFMPESNGRGVGVRLKFADADQTPSARLEGEGGITQTTGTARPERLGPGDNCPRHCYPASLTAGRWRLFHARFR